MKNALILMTALVPTTGHTDLIKFAANLPDTHVYVLINGRTTEPVPSLLRWKALNEHFKNFHNVTVHHKVSDDAPQNESDSVSPEVFWSWWENEITAAFPRVEQWDYVVASEHYGLKLAKTVGASFLPYDIDRGLNGARGSDVRANVWSNWDSVIPEFQKFLTVNAVMFGQESVGKTTMSKMVSDILGVKWFPEYARPYLETVGTDVTVKAMENIHAGQFALQNFARSKSEFPVSVFDTDLFSTVGYYEIMMNQVPSGCIRDALSSKADVYYVLPDDIPFEVDPLRYGGDRRESEIKLWTDLLDTYKLNYVLVPSGSAEFKAQWIAGNILEVFDNNVASIRGFARD